MVPLELLSMSTTKEQQQQQMSMARVALRLWRHSMGHLTLEQVLS